MAEESGVVVRRRGRQEIARLAALYRKSGMGRSEFCRSHGMALSTLARHLEKQASEQRLSANEAATGESRLIAVELAAMSSSAATGKQRSALAVLLSNGRRVEVGSGFDAATLAELVSALERL